MCVGYEESELMKRVKRALAAGIEISPRVRTEIEKWLEPFEKGLAIGRVDGAEEQKRRSAAGL